MTLGLRLSLTILLTFILCNTCRPLPRRPGSSRTRDCTRPGFGLLLSLGGRSRDASRYDDSAALVHRVATERRAPIPARLYASELKCCCAPDQEPRSTGSGRWSHGQAAGRSASSAHRAGRRGKRGQAVARACCRATTDRRSLGCAEIGRRRGPCGHLHSGPRTLRDRDDLDAAEASEELAPSIWGGSWLRPSH